MSIRLASSVTLAWGAIVVLSSGPGLRTAAAQSPPPMFSPWYAETLGQILEPEQADVVQLERQLARRPDDFRTRLKLMAYYHRADRTGQPEDRAKRISHALWLIEHHPDSELLHAPVSQFAPNELNPADYRRAVALWESAARAKPGDAAVQWNAASFFTSLDPGLHLRYLEQTAAVAPNHPFALRPLADLYARSTLGGGPLASRAQAGLEASKNVWVLGNAAYVLQSLYNQSLQAGAPNRRAAELAERYFGRAKDLDPTLDRKAILPELDMQAVARVHQAGQSAQREWEARADQAVATIRRLPVAAYPAVPAAVRGVLRARNCSVPQPAADGAARNVMRGEFFVKGQPGWAVLCSVRHSTALLIFRNDQDSHPHAINTSADRNYLEPTERGQVVYSRQITAVDRAFIMRHHRAYGGPVPPTIDHHGIDDYFLEKASITWYFYRGKWLRLQGAD